MKKLDLEKLQGEVADLKKRNRKVEADRAWEKSFSRRILITFVTYVFVVLFFFAMDLESPFINALVPSAGVIVSSLSIPVVKRYWVRYVFLQNTRAKLSSVSLSDVKTKNVRTGVHVKILDSGELMIYGYDSGKQVKELKGDSDYEYEMVLSVEEKERLRKVFEVGDDSSLLLYFKKNFEGADSFSHLRKMFDSNNIVYEYVSWE